MLVKNNELGTVTVAEEVIYGITSAVASDCFGIAGMESKNATEEFCSLFCRDSGDRGIDIRCDEEGIEIDLHIMVIYGINIPAIVDSIVHKVSYTVEDLSGFKVRSVNIFVDKVNTK